MPGLYLGPYGAAKDLPTLQAHRVTHILVIGSFWDHRDTEHARPAVCHFRRLAGLSVCSSLCSRWSWRIHLDQRILGRTDGIVLRIAHVGASDRAVRAEREACHAETSTTLPVPRMHRMRTYRHHSLQLCLLELAECWAAVGSMTCVGSLSELQVVDINDDMMENLLPYADTNQHSAMLTTDPCRSARLFRVGLTVIKTAAES